MTVADFRDSGLVWRKASRSVGNGECIEISSAQGQVFIRDSKDPNGPVLSCSPDTFRSFIDSAKRNDHARRAGQTS